MRKIEREWFGPFEPHPDTLKIALRAMLASTSAPFYDDSKDRILEVVRAQFSLVFEVPDMLDYPPKKKKFNTQEFTFSDAVPVFLEDKRTLFFLPIDVKAVVKSRYAPKRIFYLEKISFNRLDKYDIEVDFWPEIQPEYLKKHFDQESPVRAVKFKGKRAVATIEPGYSMQGDALREIVAEKMNGLYPEIRDVFFNDIKEQCGLNGFLKYGQKNNVIDWTELR